MEFPEKKYTVKCKDCGKTFTYVSTAAPPTICDPCTIPYLKAVWGKDFEKVCSIFCAKVKVVNQQQKGLS